MLTRMSAMMGATFGIALVVAAMWSWASAEQLVRRAGDPTLAAWAVRTAAVAAVAAAQVLGLSFVTVLFYDRDRAGDIMRIAAGALCTVAMIAAIAMGFLSR